MSIYKINDGIIFTTTWGSGAFSYNNKNIRTFTDIDGHKTIGDILMAFLIMK